MILSRAVLVDGLGKKFLAGSGFTMDEDIDIRGGCP